MIGQIAGALIRRVAMDPLHQFQIHPIIPIKIPIDGRVVDISFTNSSAFMVIGVAVIIGFLLVAMSSQALVPGRLQSIAEMSYEFVAGLIRDTAGRQGMQFFPFVYAIFVFILILNLLGLLPFAFTVTSHIIITFAMALGVFMTVIAVGIAKHGLGFLRLFVPSGIPIWLVPFIAVIEVFSFLTRPFSLGLRLFANMLAGHLILKVFAGFIISLSAIGVLGMLGAVVPFVVTVAMTALELLVALLQAYVFAILTSIYLNDALHPGH